MTKPKTAPPTMNPVPYHHGAVADAMSENRNTSTVAAA
jgi:hypothetical protein